MKQPIERTILCYGDSNTWGYRPSDWVSSSLQRYARSERWPGLVQKTLGEAYRVIEEGLNGRTTNLDYSIYPNRNGKLYLPPCLYTHAPLDLVILALGGNDLKVYFDRSAKDIRNGLAELIDIIQLSTYGPYFKRAPKVLILTQPVPLPIAERFVDEQGIPVFKGAIAKAQALIKFYQALAEEKGCDFLDISSTVSPSKVDGLHLNKRGHKRVAELVAEKIVNIFS